MSKKQKKQRSNMQQQLLPGTTTGTVSTLRPQTPPPKWVAPATSATATITPIKPYRADYHKPPVVYYTPHVYKVIQTLVARCGKEVGWLGTVQRIGNDYLIDKIYVPSQQVTGTETDIDQDAMAALAMEIMDAGQDPGTLYYWGHSHVNMGVSPSGQDESQVAQYLDNCPIFIREIRNKAGAVKVDVYDTTQGVVFQCVKVAVQESVDDVEFIKQMDELIKANVRDRVYVSGNYGGAYNSGNYQGGRYANGHKTPPRNTTTGVTGLSEARKTLLRTVLSYDAHKWQYVFSDNSRVNVSELSLPEINFLDDLLDKNTADLDDTYVGGFTHGYN